MDSFEYKHVYIDLYIFKIATWKDVNKLQEYLFSSINCVAHRPIELELACSFGLIFDFFFRD